MASSSVATKTDQEDNTVELKREGSFRKLVQASTNGDPQLSMPIRMVDRQNTFQNNKDYAIYFQEYSILTEYNLLRNKDLKGIYVIPSAKNSFLWFGVQFIRQGIYQGGVFRFTITLSTNFPDGKIPTVVFQSKVFHPLIDYETGKLNTIWGFPEWKRNNRIWQLVQYITKIFLKFDMNMIAVNEEAAKLLNSNFEAFKEKVKICVKESLNKVYDPPCIEDSYYIKFSPYNKELHDPIKAEIYKSKVKDESKAVGHSWVQPHSLKPFSKSDEKQIFMEKMSNE